MVGANPQLLRTDVGVYLRPFVRVSHIVSLEWRLELIQCLQPVQCSMQLGYNFAFAPRYGGIVKSLPLDLPSSVQQPMVSKSQPVAMDFNRLQLVGQTELSRVSKRM
jgi:hypothetical protein